MASSNKTEFLICSHRNSKTNKMCGNKSSKETNIETAFSKAEKQGWTSNKISDKTTHYYCAKCSHQIKLLKKVS